MAAYRHLHDRFRELGVDNVVWVWTVSGYLPNGGLFKRLYPGDDYVDWIGMDQYNYYLCHKTTDWQSFADSQKPTYDWLRANVSDRKPIMLSEFATAPDPSRSQRAGQWYEQVPGVAKSALPDAKALVMWDQSVPGKNCDLTVDSGSALAGYRRAGSDAYFRQPVPGR